MKIQSLYQKSYLLRVPFWARMGHTPLSFSQVLSVPSPFIPYLTNVLQVLDVVSLCAYDLIDDVGPHLVFGGLAHPKASGVVLFASLYLQGIIFHGLILVYSQLCRHTRCSLFVLLNTTLPRKFGTLDRQRVSSDEV